MKNIILSLGLLASANVFAQINQAEQPEKSQVQTKCEEVQKDEKNKNFSSGSAIDGSSYSCTFNRMFGSSYCEGLGGVFKKAIFSSGTCTIGGTTE